METIRIGWRSNFVPEDASRTFTFRFPYRSLVVLYSNIPIRVRPAGLLAEEAAYEVPSGVRTTITPGSEFDTLVIEKGYAPFLDDTDITKILGRTVIELREWEEEEVAFTSFPTELGQTPAAPYSPVGTNDIRKPGPLPIVRALADMMQPNGIQSSLHSANMLEDFTGGNLLATGLYGKETTWRPLKIDVNDKLLVSLSGEVVPVTVQNASLPVTVGNTVPVDPRGGDIVQHYYGIVVPPSGTAGATVSSTTETPVFAIRGVAAFQTVLEQLLLFIFSASAAVNTAWYLKRFTGTLTGGTALTPGAYRTDSGASSISAAYGSISVGGLIATPRSSFLARFGITGSATTTNPPALPQPVELVRAPIVIGDEGYALTYQGSAVSTVTYALLAIIREVR